MATPPGNPFPVRLRVSQRHVCVRALCPVAGPGSGAAAGCYAAGRAVSAALAARAPRLAKGDGRSGEGLSGAAVAARSASRLPGGVQAAGGAAVFLGSGVRPGRAGPCGLPAAGAVKRGRGFPAARRGLSRCPLLSFPARLRQVRVWGRLPFGTRAALRGTSGRCFREDGACVRGLRDQPGGRRTGDSPGLGRSVGVCAVVCWFCFFMLLMLRYIWGRVVLRARFGGGSGAEDAPLTKTPCSRFVLLIVPDCVSRSGAGNSSASSKVSWSGLPRVVSGFGVLWGHRQPL